jgi:hypothetical protein
LIRRLYEARQESGALTAFLIQLKLPPAGEYRETFRCVHEITRECGSSPKLIERKCASENQETFRGFFPPPARSNNEKRRSVT